ncbi:unnamed protein product, partial [Candidula unifasciata]
MDKMVNKAVQLCCRRLKRKHLLFPPNFWRPIQTKGFSKQSDAHSILSQLTIIQSSNNICNNCLAGRLGLPTLHNIKQLSNVLHKQLKVLTSILMKSNWLQGECIRQFIEK